MHEWNHSHLPRGPLPGAVTPAGPGSQHSRDILSGAGAGDTRGKCPFSRRRLQVD